MSQFDFLASRLGDPPLEQNRRQLVTGRSEGIEWVLPDGRRRINFGSNDYLGLASTRHTAVVPTGSTASALVCGWTDRHQVLAEALAQFESTESAVVFPSGFAACLGTVATLAGPDDLILSDELNHASLIDGCRLSRAKRVIYPHRDWQQVRACLQQSRDQYQQVWIVTDGIFSMDGDVAPLGELTDVADEFDARLIVDEAHGTGVMGAGGSGICEELGVKQEIPIRIGTLSKAVGSQGGFVVGPNVVIDYLVNRCRSLIYSTALAPAAVETAISVIDSMSALDVARQRVRHLAASLRSMLNLPDEKIEQQVPILPLVLGDSATTVEWSRELAEQGFFVPAIRPPTVPVGKSRLRISLSAVHTDEMVENLATAIRGLGWPRR